MGSAELFRSKEIAQQPTVAGNVVDQCGETNSTFLDSKTKH